MFEKMGRAETAEGGDRIPGFLRTHPHSSDRCAPSWRAGRQAGRAAGVPAVQRCPPPPSRRHCQRYCRLDGPHLCPLLPLCCYVPPPPPGRVKAIQKMLPLAEGLYEFNGCEAARGPLAQFRAVLSRPEWGRGQ
jgi:hypothetical protein